MRSSMGSCLSDDYYINLKALSSLSLAILVGHLCYSNF